MSDVSSVVEQGEAKNPVTPLNTVRVSSHGGRSVVPEDVAAVLSDAGFVVVKQERTLHETLDALEKNLIQTAYVQANGVKRVTARLLGIKESSLYYKLEKYGFIRRDEAGNVTQGQEASERAPQ